MSTANRQTEQATLGTVLADTPITVALAAVGLIAAIVGSLGPWATLFAISIAGTHGDGKITIVAAILALIVLAVGERMLAAVISLVIVAVGIYDLAHIDHVAGRIVLFGIHPASPGWGIYTVIGGGVLAVLALAATIRQR